METNASPLRGTAIDLRASPSSRLLLVRYGGDLTTKARQTRQRFAARLAHNIRDALSAEQLSAQVRRSHDRIYVEGDEPIPARLLARVFGVQSVSCVERRPWASLDEIVAAGVDLFTGLVQGREFAIRARRVGTRQQIPVSASDIQNVLGDALRPIARGVNLENPDVTLRIEVMPGQAYFFTSSESGPGGLPLGVEGRAVALVSGGFDSAVAAWHLMKRGVGLDYVFCNLGGRTHQLGTLRVMELIARNWSYGTRPRFHAIDFDAVSSDLQKSVHERYRQVILKRLMLRAAETVARETGALAIITGDAVGQVSSQTLTNLASISEATSLPILRPLVGANKDEILGQARRIGTFELSKVVGEYCALVPRKPATAAALDVVLDEDARLDPQLLERAVAERSVFDIRRLDLGLLDLPDLEVEEIDPGAAVIDLRSKAAYENWHYPDALFLDFAHALRAVPHLSREKSYVLYCEFGLKSAHLAERMRAEGLDASHFKGGSANLSRWMESRGGPAAEK